MQLNSDWIYIYVLGYSCHLEKVLSINIRNSKRTIYIQINICINTPINECRCLFWCFIASIHVEISHRVWSCLVFAIANALKHSLPKCCSVQLPAWAYYIHWKCSMFVCFVAQQSVMYEIHRSILGVISFPYMCMMTNKIQIHTHTHTAYTYVRIANTFPLTRSTMNKVVNDSCCAVAPINENHVPFQSICSRYFTQSHSLLFLSIRCNSELMCMYELVCVCLWTVQSCRLGWKPFRQIPLRAMIPCTNDYHVSCRTMPSGSSHSDMITFMQLMKSDISCLYFSLTLP